MDSLGQLGAKKIQAKIMMRKQLNNYDGVLSQLKGTEQIEMEDVDKNKENETKTQPNENEHNNAVDNKYKARWIDLGFLQSKLIKNIFCCLSERQQIGKKIFSRFILSSLTSSQDSSS